jgi:hypothetical protein
MISWLDIAVDRNAVPAPAVPSVQEHD